MSPWIVQYLYPIMGFPRVSGDEPLVVATERPDPRFSPCERG